MELGFAGRSVHVFPQNYSNVYRCAKRTRESKPIQSYIKAWSPVTCIAQMSSAILSGLGNFVHLISAASSLAPAQSIQNIARVTVFKHKSYHVTPLHRTLQWRFPFFYPSPLAQFPEIITAIAFSLVYILTTLNIHL